MTSWGEKLAHIANSNKLCIMNLGELSQLCYLRTSNTSIMFSRVTGDWRHIHTKTWTYDSVTDKMNVFGTCVLWKQLLCLPCGIKGTICYLIVPSAETGYRRVAGCVTTPPFPVTRLPQCPVPNQWPHPTDLSGHNRWAARFSPSAPFINEVDVLLASKVTRHVKISDPFNWAQDSIHFARTWTEDIFGMGSPILFHQT